MGHFTEIDFECINDPNKHLFGGTPFRANLLFGYAQSCSERTSFSGSTVRGVLFFLGKSSLSPALQHPALSTQQSPHHTSQQNIPHNTIRTQNSSRRCLNRGYAGKTRDEKCGIPNVTHVSGQPRVLPQEMLEYRNSQQDSQCKVWYAIGKQAVG